MNKVNDMILACYVQIVVWVERLVSKWYFILPMMLGASCIWKTQLYIKYFLAKLCSTCEADQPHDLVLRFLTEQDVAFASPVWTYNLGFIYSSYFYFTEQSNFSAMWNPT